MKKHITVVRAEYVDSYKVNIFFSDGTNRIVDFENFLKDNPHPCNDKYLIKTNFRKFKIDAGNLVWGKDWDIIFPVQALYLGNLKLNCNDIEQKVHSVYVL
jgi:hypothetical protein